MIQADDNPTVPRWPDEVDITIGSLDAPERVVPTAHIWMEDAANWDRPGDGLPCHARSRLEGLVP